MADVDGAWDAASVSARLRTPRRAADLIDLALSLFGRMAAYWDNLRLLKNLLILRDRERADPAILDRPVRQPIFVMGLPSSGTSFLHALLAEDEANQAPRC